MTVRFNRPALAEFLMSEASHRMVQEVADKIAGHIRDQHVLVGPTKGEGGTSEDPVTGEERIEIPVEVEVVTTDRAHARVLLAHPAGIAAQAKYGLLTKGASSAGVGIRSK